MSSTASGAAYMPPDDMNTTEAPSAWRSSGSRPFGHQVRTQDVAGKLSLMRLRRLDAFLRHGACVVYEAVEFVDAPAEVIAPRPHGVQIGDIAYLFDHHRLRNRAPDRTGGVFDLLLVSAQQVDGRTEFGERDGDRLPDAGCRARDDDPLSGHGIAARIGRPPQPSQP